MRTKKLRAPFVITLIAGLLVIADGGTEIIRFLSGIPMWGGMMGGMMDNWQGMMGGIGFGGFFFGLGLFGIVSGIILLLGAFMLYSQPKQASIWGVIILVFSLLSFFGMEGFNIGALLGVAGGMLAMTRKPTQQ